MPFGHCARETSEPTIKTVIIHDAKTNNEAASTEMMMPGELSSDLYLLFASHGTFLRAADRLRFCFAVSRRFCVPNKGEPVDRVSFTVRWVITSQDVGGVREVVNTHLL